MSAWYSVLDVLQSTPGVMLVYWRGDTRILLCVTRGWELPVPLYHVIYGDVACDMYMSYICHMLLSSVFMLLVAQINTTTNLRQLLLS